MTINKTVIISGIRYHSADVQPNPEDEDVLFVDTRTTFTETDTGQETHRHDVYRLTSTSDIASEPTIVQAVWNVIFGQSALDQAAQAIAAAAALAAATTSTSTSTSTVVVNP